MEVYTIADGVGVSSPEVTPLPSSAWGGLVLIGCFGGAEVIRRRKDAVAI
jgi:hypothetical protein